MVDAAPDVNAIPAKSRRLPAWFWLDWRERRRKLHREGWMVLAVLYGALLFAYLLPPDFRNTSVAYVMLAWAAMMVRTLQFHAGLLVLVIAGVALLAQKWRLALAALPLLVLVFGPALLLYLPRSHPAPAGKPLRVFSANLLMINDYTDGIIAEIDAADPDVVLLQEFTVHWQNALDGHFGQKYPNRVCLPQDDSFGIAVYSKIPFVDKPKDNLPLGAWPLPQLRAVIQHEGREIALYNIHLVPPRSLEYATQHRLEFADLVDQLAAEKIPVLITGDFNATETTPQAYALRRAGLSDAHDLAGFGHGGTWPVNSFLRYLPGLRLDHIFLSPSLTAANCRTGTGQGSDHRPLVADIAFK